MSLRHAAAFALVGWYLMMPPKLAEGPPNKNGDRRIYVPQSFLWQWIILKSFDTAKECEEGARALAKPLHSAVSARQQHLSLDDLRPLYARCFATDDPRLKEK